MSFIDLLWNTMMEFLHTAHPAVIHFPIIGILASFMAGSTALLIKIVADIAYHRDWIDMDWKELAYRFVDRFEFTSYVLIFLGMGGYVIAGVTGFFSIGGVEPAINNTLLEYKVRLSLYAFVLCFTPIFLKTYIGIVFRRNVFTNESYILPILYLLPLVVAAGLTSVVAGTGGKYVYGHSILEIFGLSFLLPEG